MLLLKEENMSDFEFEDFFEVVDEYEGMDKLEIKNEEIATGPHIRRIQGLNLPACVPRDLSQMRPIVTSVNASTNLAIIITIPTLKAETPITSV